MTRPLLRPTPVPLIVGAVVLALALVASGDVLALTVMARASAVRHVDDGLAAVCPVVVASQERP